MAQQLDPQEQEDLITSGIRFFPNFGFRQTCGLKSFAGCLSNVPMILQLLSFTLFTALLLAVLIQVSKIPSSQEQGKQEMSKELTQLKAGVARLCRPCAWDWTFFQGNCYFFSKSKRNWHDSVTTCEEVGAQLVVIKSAEEQSFLQSQTSDSQRLTWMGLSDLKHEGTWHWLDGSPLLSSFKKYWNDGEPNNIGDEDCAEFKGNGWNDVLCNTENFWICKKLAAACSSD
ncbi:CD209 antigen [Cynocephalus volans]|uniref:CD209 antigen n=1 Tax=Cynocephalus volans TaxID=110931 RepID=UPI002FC6E4A4